VKKDAKLSANQMPEKEEGNGEEDLQCNNLFTVCRRHLDWQRLKRQGWLF